MATEQMNNKKGGAEVAPLRAPGGCCHAAAVVKAAGFAAIFLFCTLAYGDVFVRAQQESYIAADGTVMDFLLSRPGGRLYWAARWLLASYKNVWIGGLLLSAILTGGACQAAHILRKVAKPARPMSESAVVGAAFILPAAILAAMVAEGTNLYYKFEPSRIFIWPIFCLLGLAAVSAGMAFLSKGGTVASNKGGQSLKAAIPGLAVVAAVFGTLAFYAVHTRQNVVLTARMQNSLWEQDWQRMIDDGLAARRPTRAVAAYYAVALLQTGQLPDRLFAIPFDYPDSDLEKVDGNEEYGQLLADCNFEAGLVLGGYHHALERTVMNGVSVRNLKRLAVAAIMLGEDELARKYLHLISMTPFEGGFIAKYAPMLEDRSLISQDGELRNVEALKPTESRYEQNYREPLFMGYNVGLGQGSDAALVPSATACMYAKMLDALMPRLAIMQQKGMAITPLMEQAALCYLAGHSGAQLPIAVSDLTKSQFSSFVADVQPVMKDKERMREEMKEKWLGSYFYYYYCENNDEKATGVKDKNKSEGVN